MSEFACDACLGVGSDAVELGEETSELLPAEDVTIEGNLGSLPMLDDGDQAGDAVCVFDEAPCDGQFEAGISTSTRLSPRSSM
jgi:hypothetical protein